MKTLQLANRRCPLSSVLWLLLALKNLTIELAVYSIQHVYGAGMKYIQSARSSRCNLQPLDESSMAGSIDYRRTQALFI